MIKYKIKPSLADLFDENAVVKFCRKAHTKLCDKDCMHYKLCKARKTWAIEGFIFR
jgi:hypothetical protein